MRAVVGLLVGVALFFVPAEAMAAVTASFDGTTLVLTGTAEDESLTLTGTATTITVSSDQGVVGACESDVPCTVDRNATVRADLGTGADVFDARTFARNVFVTSTDGGDTIHAGSGADTINLQGADNQVWAGAGGDVISGAGTLRGEEGSDYVSGDGTLEGGSGDDSLEGVFVASLDGGEDRDTVWFSRAGDVRISLDGMANDGAGALRMSNVINAEVLVGGAGNDELSGNGDDQDLRGAAGDDTLTGAGGADDLAGGLGADTLDGGDGDDLLAGGDGADVLRGGNGTDGLDGSDGDDVLAGGDGADALAGGLGADRLDGGAGDDDLGGGDGDDTLDGGAGSDTLGGGNDADVVRGGSAPDALDGGGGDDSLEALDGERDEVDCGDGTDRVSADAIDRLTGCEPVVQPSPPTVEPTATATATATPDVPAAPAGTPPPARIAVVDAVAPIVGVSVPARARLTSGLATSVNCSEACSVKIELRVDPKLAKRDKLPRVLASGTGRLAAPGTVKVTIKPSASVRRRLLKVKSPLLKATLATTATDGAGNARTVSRTVTLSR